MWQQEGRELSDLGDRQVVACSVRPGWGCSSVSLCPNKLPLNPCLCLVWLLLDGEEAGGSVQLSWSSCSPGGFWLVEAPGVGKGALDAPGEGKGLRAGSLAAPSALGAGAGRMMRVMRPCSGCDGSVPSFGPLVAAHPLPVPALSLLQSICAGQP